MVQLVEISGGLGWPYPRSWFNPEMLAPNNISSVAALSPDASRFVVVESLPREPRYMRRAQVMATLDYASRVT
jgi:hypothetical protein